MRLKTSQLRSIKIELRRFPSSEPADRIENFVARVLGLTSLQVPRYFPGSGDLDGAANIAEVTAFRSEMLDTEGVVPSFVCYSDHTDEHWVQGLSSNLLALGVSKVICDRLQSKDAVRARIRAFAAGFELEALGAALIEEQIGEVGAGFATQRSRDGGVDVVGLRNLAMSRLEFSTGSLSHGVSRTSPILFIVGSAKCAEKPGTTVALAPPAHIRELVGTWTIQRTPIGRWHQLGIKPLSPVVPVFITTYRLSDETLAECVRLGIEVWGIPQLVWLVTCLAPSAVFPSNGGTTSFDTVAFDRWWVAYEGARVAVSSVGARNTAP